LYDTRVAKSKPPVTLLGALKPYASITDHPLAVIDGRVASATIRYNHCLDKLGADDAAIAVLNELVHVDFSYTNYGHREDAFWQKLAMPRGRCLEGVHAWGFVEHARGIWLERVTELRKFGFNTSGDLSAGTTMLSTLRRNLPALDVLECVGISARDAELLDAVFAGAKTQVICELRGGETPARPLANIETRRLGPLDRTWLDRLLTAATRDLA
jgi:hypothetical protein